MPSPVRTVHHPLAAADNATSPGPPTAYEHSPIASHPHIHVLILNWNGYSLTEACVSSVCRSNYHNYSISVIDNNSSDASVSNLRARFPHIHVIALDANYGYGAAYNRAFRQLRWAGEYYMLLNNDTIVSEDALATLASTIHQLGKHFLYGPKIYYYDNPDTIWYAGGSVNLPTGRLSHVGIRKTDRSLSPQSGYTDYITGCCLLAHTDILKALNGFDPRFAMYSEDVDLCLRAQRLGVPSYFVSSAIIYHKVSASIGGHLSPRKQLQKVLSFSKLASCHTTLPTAFIGTLSYISRLALHALFIPFTTVLPGSHK